MHPVESSQDRILRLSARRQTRRTNAPEMHGPRFGPLRPFALLLLLSLVANVCDAQSDLDIIPIGETAELDLVFPRPNQTYKRAYPFPVVFAFQGMKQAWPHHVTMDWSVIGRQDVDEALYSSSGGFPRDLPWDTRGDEYSSGWTEGESPGGLDTVFFTVGADNVLNSTATTFSIVYSFSFHYNCTYDESTGQVSGLPNFSYSSRGNVTFHVDDDGLDLDVALPDGECATGLATLRMKSSLLERTPEDPPCVILDEEDLSPEPAPCDVKLPDDMQSSVQSLMLQTAECSSGSWPAETLVAPCNDPPPEDDDSSVGPVGVPVLLAAVAGLVSMWVALALGFR